MPKKHKKKAIMNPDEIINGEPLPPIKEEDMDRGQPAKGDGVQSPPPGIDQAHGSVFGNPPKQ